MDPIKSFGGILYFDVDRFLGSLNRILAGEYQVEHWTTLEGRIPGLSIIFRPHPAVGDFFIGEYSNLFMSRNFVYEQAAYIDGKEIMPEKSSGILVVTGAGSGKGSWYNNIHQCYFGKPDEFGREEEIARIIARENEARAKTNLYKGQRLVLDSYNDARGILSPDSHEEHSINFDIGTQVEIWISDLKLPVIKNN